jgi:ABC-type multidrug transport system fused ATPase/permease subunit
MNFNIAYIMKLLYSLLVIILLVLVYTYITSLEQKGCICAMTPDNNFIKGFTLFAIIYLIFTAFVPEETLTEMVGPTIVFLYKFIDLIFVLVFIYYIYVVFRYTRYLVDEKCKCSVDMRREIIMVGSLIELVLLVILFILGVVTITIFSVLFTVIKTVSENSDNARDAIRDPIGSISKLPKALQKEYEDIRDYVSKTSSEIKKIGNRRSKKLLDPSL